MGAIGALRERLSPVEAATTWSGTADAVRITTIAASSSDGFSDADMTGRVDGLLLREPCGRRTGDDESESHGSTGEPPTSPKQGLGDPSRGLECLTCSASSPRARLLRVEACVPEIAISPAGRPALSLCETASRTSTRTYAIHTQGIQCKYSVMGKQWSYRSASAARSRWA